MGNNNNDETMTNIYVQSIPDMCVKNCELYISISYLLENFVKLSNSKKKKKKNKCNIWELNKFSKI